MNQLDEKRRKFLEDIGRHITDKRLRIALDCHGSISHSSWGDGAFELLPEFLQELGRDFIRKVQRLHDDVINWTDGGLSETGCKVLADIKKEFNL
jgi:hypothetical protein